MEMTPGANGVAQCPAKYDVIMPSYLIRFNGIGPSNAAQNAKTSKSDEAARQYLAALGDLACSFRIGQDGEYL